MATLYDTKQHELSMVDCSCQGISTAYKYDPTTKATSMGFLTAFLLIFKPYCTKVTSRSHIYILCPKAQVRATLVTEKSGKSANPSTVGQIPANYGATHVTPNLLNGATPR
jgi:hypothetical protein